jgi:hypothetical protein
MATPRRWPPPDHRRRQAPSRLPLPTTASAGEGGQRRTRTERRRATGGTAGGHVGLRVGVQRPDGRSGKMWGSPAGRPGCWSWTSTPATPRRRRSWPRPGSATAGTCLRCWPAKTRPPSRSTPTGWRHPAAGNTATFRSPDPPLGNSTGRLGWGIDTRGAGGYVIGAGSLRRINGRPTYYTLLQSGPPAALPDWLATRLIPPDPTWPGPALLDAHHGIQGEAGAARVRAYVGAAVAGEVHKVRSALPGTRNNALFIAAAHLGSLLVSAYSFMRRGGYRRTGSVADLVTMSGCERGVVVQRPLWTVIVDHGVMLKVFCRTGAASRWSGSSRHRRAL